MKDPRSIRLSEGLTAEQQAELGDLGPTQERMARYMAPEPSAAETARLLAKLRPLVAARADQALLPAWTEPKRDVRHWLSLAWSQTTLVEPPFWWASAVVLLIGLTLGLLGQTGTVAAGFVLIAPVAAAAGVAYFFRPANRSTWELEKSCPIQPLELLYARLGLVLSFNLAASLLVMGVISLQEPRAVLWRLAITWLGPMLAMAGAALYASVRWGAIAGVTVPLTLWYGLLYVSWRTALLGNPALHGMDLSGVLTAATQSDAVLAAAVAAMLVGLLLLRQGSRQALGDDAAWS